MLQLPGGLVKGWFKISRLVLLLMEEIPNNHLGCIEPCKQWDNLPTSTGAGFCPSTVCLHDIGYFSAARFTEDLQELECWIERPTDPFPTESSSRELTGALLAAGYLPWKVGAGKSGWVKSWKGWRKKVAELGWEDGRMGGLFWDEDLFGGIWISETRKWIEDCDNALCFFSFSVWWGRFWYGKIMEDLQGVILKNNLVQLMLIVWPVPTWGMSNTKLCTQELQVCQAQKKLAVVITDSPCYGKDCSNSHVLGAWSERCVFFVTCFTSTDQV